MKPILSIQYLRGIAALMVVWHHALALIPGTMDFIRLPPFGKSGVDIFFVISGFIMVATTADKPIIGRRFFELRIVRVVPLYWLATLAMMGTGLLVPAIFKTLKFDGVSVAKSLLFIPYDSLSWPGNVWPVLIPGWTLNFEMFFYALFAITLYLPKWRLSTLLGTLAGLVAVGSIVGRSGPLVTVYTSPMLLEFGLGAWLAHDWQRRSPDNSLFGPIAMMWVGALLLVKPDSQIDLIVGALLLVAGALEPRIRDINNRLLLELGNASYSIYLTHLFALGILRAVWVRAWPQVSMGSSIVFMATALAWGAAAGWVCYKIIEKPMTRWLQTSIRRRSPIPAVDAQGQGVTPGSAALTVASNAVTAAIAADRSGAV